MIDGDIINKLAYLEGWRTEGQEMIAPEVYGGEIYDMSCHKVEEILPDYFNDHNILHKIEERYDDPNNLTKRVKWLNALRETVSGKKPKNKSGQSLVSDYDMLRASCRERCEAILKTEGEWKK